MVFSLFLELSALECKQLWNKILSLICSVQCPIQSQMQMRADLEHFNDGSKSERIKKRKLPLLINPP